MGMHRLCVHTHPIITIYTFKDEREVSRACDVPGNDTGNVLL